VVPRSIPIAGPSPFPAIEFDSFVFVAKKERKICERERKKITVLITLRFVRSGTEVEVSLYS
jgi:hypothetical protein